jgi:chemotaxis response regulator CheB
MSKNIIDKKINVVIADDSEYLRKSISKILSTNKEIYVVNEAKNGKETIEKVKKYRPEVLILDLLMPQMNGLDAFKTIMASIPTPTIILSALNPQNMDTSIQALMLGAFDYIIKPGGLGAKTLPKFKDELISKVILASKSQIKRIFGRTNNELKKKYIRQELVDEAFRFGQYINKLKPLNEFDEQEANSSHNSFQQEFDSIQLSKNKILEQKSQTGNRETQKLQKPKSEKNIRSIPKTTKASMDFKENKKGNLDITKMIPVDNIHISTNLIVIGASVG